MNQKFRAIFTALVALSVLISHASATFEIETCVVTDFQAGKILYSYSSDNAGDVFTSRGNPVVKIADRLGFSHSPLFQIGNTASQFPNKDDECYNSNLRVCMATIGLLTDVHTRSMFSMDSVTVLTSAPAKILKIASSASGTFVECLPVGRDLTVVESAETGALESPSSNNIDYDFNFGGAEGNGNNFGVNQKVSTVTTYFDTSNINNNLVGLSVSLSGGASQSFGNVTAGGSIQAGPTTGITANSIQTVSVYYTAGFTAEATSGTVCGLQLSDNIGTTIVDSGCSTNVRTFTITTGQEFAGFAGFHATGSIATLYPVDYKRLQPVMLYYEPQPNRVFVYMYAFFAMDGVLTYATNVTSGIDNSTGELMYETASGLTRGSAGSGLETIQVNTGCGCIPVTLTINTPNTNNAAWMYENPGSTYSFTVWSVGWKEENEEEVLSTGTVGGNTYLPGTLYKTQTDSQKCPEVYPQLYAPSVVGGTVYMDGLIGPITDGVANAAPAISTLTETPNAVNQVDVYFNANLLEGLRFSWDGTNAYSIGTTTGTANTLQASTPNSKLSYIKFQRDTTGSATRVTAIFTRALAPCFIQMDKVEDVDGVWATPNGSPLTRTEKLEADADMYMFYFYIPVDYSRLRAEVYGYFLTEGNMYNMTLMPAEGMMTFDRATVVKAYFYHLQAEHMYNVTFWGNLDNHTIDMADLMSYETTTDDFVYSSNYFMTPHGIRLDCETNGDTWEQVEWEALPDVEIKCYDGAAISQLNSQPTVSTTSGSKAVHSAMFPNYQYFHYDDNPNCYPKFPEFIGYPKDIIAYYDTNSTANAFVTDSCIRGLALVYKDRNDNDYNMFLAGDQNTFTNAAGQGYATFSQNINFKATSVWGSTSTQNGVTCLSSIQFRDGSGGVTTCIGPQTGGSQCNTQLDVENDPSSLNYYVHGLDVSTDNSGQFITGLVVNYAYIDVPAVESNAQCILTKVEDMYYIRNTYYYKNVKLNDTSGDYATCGIAQYVYPDHQSNQPDATDQRNPQDPMDKHEVAYHQALIRTRDRNDLQLTDNDGGGMSVVRKNEWEVNLFCYYNASGQVKSSFSVEGEAPQYVSGTNEFKFRLVMYKDNKFQQPYTNGEVPIMWLGESVHMAVEWDTTLREQPAGYYVRGYECWATRSAAMTRVAGQYYDLSGSDGCSSDASFTWDTDRRTVDMDPFYFDAFAWMSGNAIDPTATVYINCRVRACEDSINDAVANDFCYKPNENNDCAGGALNTRKRRDAKYSGKTVEQMISSTPIIIKRRDTLNIERGPAGPVGFHFLGGDNSVRMTSALFSMFVTTMFFCLLVVSYRVYKLRNNYKIMKEMVDQN